MQPYDGWADPPPAPRLLSIPETMDFWRRLHRCIAQTMQPVPHRAGGDATVAQRMGWSVCARGGPGVLFLVVGGEHEPPAKSRGQDIDAAGEDGAQATVSPVASSTPVLRLIVCTAAPDAPLPRLSSEATARICSSAGLA